MKKSCRSGYWAMAWLLLSLMLTITSCIREEEFDNTPQGNFEALWQMIDEHYCFFDYKQNEYGLDWNEVRDRYAPLITPDMPQKGLFEVLGNMLAELRDGHVNLYTTYDVARYWKWYEDYPANFNDSIQRRYLGTNYKIAGGLKYTILNDNIAYVYYESFSTGIGDGNLSEMLNELAFCNGLILDVRNNGGGMLTNATKLAARFTNKEVTTGYMCHKTGTGHNDFSAPEAVKITPSDGVRWQKPVALLTNRRSYSATNDFVNSMRQLPLVTVIGDRTGGGSGMPFSSELPNGWSVRFSACPMYGPDMEQLEFGIEPDIHVNMTSEDMNRGIDTIIEKARSVLSHL
ncbi:MAG: S41 family peptidase [Bacteroidaceae bacterium]|nr:S41 family peptidase [Bacteroidaceae bacterium]